MQNYLKIAESGYGMCASIKNKDMIAECLRGLMNNAGKHLELKIMLKLNDGRY